ncbi:ATP-binding protein [Streptomyces sp. NPDC048629]|uniref:ATP-binding protein n=1 Tax=Streptomyces sp. NPDC048629 TaxID=3154824 RepID=UPI00342571D6
MTTHLVGQERTHQRALAAAEEPKRHEGPWPALEVSIERRPDPGSDALSEADAVWPGRLRRIIRAALCRWGRPDLVDVAELLVTELATNSLCHADGPTIGVRMYFRGADCVIEVTDGSPSRPLPRPAGPDDENGRGLLLVDELADSWGVSDHGTTWCTLSLTQGTPEMEPAALTAPVLRTMPLELPATSGASMSARISARELLTRVQWPGNVHAAVGVLNALVENAVEHGLTAGATGQRLGACLRVTEAQDLLIEVTDPNPTFPNFDQAVAGEEEGRGLWRAKQHGAQLVWFVDSDAASKTVRATLRPGRVAP